MLSDQTNELLARKNIIMPMSDEPQTRDDMVRHKEVLSMLEEQDRITNNFYSDIDEQRIENINTVNYAFDELRKNLEPLADGSW